MHPIINIILVTVIVGLLTFTGARVEERAGFWLALVYRGALGIVGGALIVELVK
jgi:hypothetical protein